jgi:type IV pilus assembly protein PilF
MLFRGLAVAVALSVALPVAAQDWKGRGRISGKVVDADGKPIAGATVKLELPERGGGTTVTTGKDGKWALGGIASGTWHVDVQAEGFAPMAGQVNLPSEAARMSPLEIRLEKAQPKGPSAEVVAALDTAESLFKGGRYAEARAEFERLLGELPEHAVTIHQRIGLCYIQEKNYPKALESLGHVLEAQPDNQQIRAIAAQAALEGGMTDKGRELLATLDETTIQSPDVFFNMGVNFLNANAPEDAIRYFGKAVALDPGYVDGYYRRALANLQIGKKDECRVDLQKVVELAPDSQMGQMAKKALESLQ